MDYFETETTVLLGGSFWISPPGNSAWLAVLFGKSKQASEGSFSMGVSGFFFKANYTRGFFGAVAGFFFFTRCFSQIMPLVSHSFALELKHSSPPNAVA